jgi:hypothetical protein
MTARRRRCASVIFERSLIALSLHQPREHPREPQGHLQLTLGRRLPHRSLCSSVTSASWPDISTSVFARGSTPARTARAQPLPALKQQPPGRRRAERRAPARARSATAGRSSAPALGVELRRLGFTR